MGRNNHRQMLLRYQKERQRNVLAQSGVHDFALVLDNLKPGFNVAKIFRSAEAFGAHSVHMIDIGPFDPAPAKGSFRKVPAVFYEVFSDCYQHLCDLGYTMYVLEPTGGKLLYNTRLPSKSAFIFGHEEFGHSFDKTLYPNLQRLTIPQFGSVQSINVSIAASIVMYEYLRQHLEKGSST